MTDDLHARGDAELLAANRRFYDSLWAWADLSDPERFSTWPLVRSLVRPATRRLEVAPGLRPRLPISGTYFVDISTPALARLHASGGIVALGLATALPFRDGEFDLLSALDISNMSTATVRHSTSWRGWQDLAHCCCCQRRCILRGGRRSITSSVTDGDTSRTGWRRSSGSTGSLSSEVQPTECDHGPHGWSMWACGF